MKISATSALVLNWTDLTTWKTPEALSYIDQLDFINFYSAEEIVDMLKEVGYQKISATNMQQIQEERTGDKFPFTEENSCWVMNIYAGDNR